MLDPLLDAWEELGRPVFRPSDMTDWLKCPAFRQLKTQGVEPVTLKWSPAILLGTAIHAGMAHAYRNWGTDHLQDARQRVQETLQKGFVDNPEWDLGALEKIALKGLQASLDVDVPAGRAILKVDEVLKVGHPDLILGNPDGTLTIVDLKCTMSLDPRWEVKRLAEFETADQWWHYAWEAQEVLGKPVQPNGGLVAHVTPLTPRVRSFTHAWDAHPYHIQQWFRGAVRNWIDMERERRGLVGPTWKLSGCHGKYGKCPYFMLHWDLRDNLEAAVEAGIYAKGNAGENSGNVPS